MEIKLPYVNTRIEADILLTLLLTPVWWVLGFGIFTYHITVILVFIKLLTGSLHSDRGVRIPKELICFGFFLLSYLASILINIPYRPSQRIFASLNNYLMLVMGFLIMVAAYNSDLMCLLRGFFKTCRYLCMASIVIGAAALAYWFRCRSHFEADAWLAQKIPSLLDYPYFYVLLRMTGTMSDWFSDSEFPRLTLYSKPPTATGGLMVMIIPMMMAYYAFTRKKKPFEFMIVSVLSFAVLVFSIARSAIYGFVLAWVLVRVLKKDKKTIFLFGALLLVAFFSGAVDRVIEFILNVRKSSTIGRFELYEDAFRIVSEQNPIMGLGVHLRENFTMTAIGSHAVYVDILFVTGILGLLFFLVFQGMVMAHWYSQKKFLKNKTEYAVWEFLGVSLLGANIWLFSDTIIAVPHIAYVYFLITGSVLLFGRFLRSAHLTASFLNAKDPSKTRPLFILNPRPQGRRP